MVVHSVYRDGSSIPKLVGEFCVELVKYLSVPQEWFVDIVNVAWKMIFEDVLEQSIDGGGP
jgi:hypothetical protein